MITFIICVCLWIATMILYQIMVEDLFITIWCVGFGGGIVGFVLLCFLIPFTGGIVKNYAQGEYVGYITKIEKEGVIWKTWEGSLQVGIDKYSSQDNVKSFCVPKDKEELLQKIKSNYGTGQKISLIYNEWLMTPYWIGSSNRVVLDIKILE